MLGRRPGGAPTGAAIARLTRLEGLDTAMAGATEEDRQARSAVLVVESCDLFLDLTVADDRFRSRSELKFRCRGDRGGIVADLQAAAVNRITLNGVDLGGDDLDADGRLRLARLDRENDLTVDAEFAFTDAGQGLHRVAGGPQAGLIYSRANRGGASQIFCCFDQPDLRVPFSVAVRAPGDWWCRANYPATSSPPGGTAGVWQFAPTPPIAPYLFALCAGPTAGIGPNATSGDRVPLTVWAPASSGEMVVAQSLLLYADASLQEFERVLGLPCPDPKVDFVFLPDLVPLAFTTPGLSTLQDRLLERAPDRSQEYLACVMAHEVAHLWVGGLVDIRGADRSWLQEALATYLGRVALEETRPGCAPWEPDTSSQLPDDAYAEDAMLVHRLEGTIGRSAVMSGLAAVMVEHERRTVTIDDLVEAWSATGGRDLGAWAAARRLSAP